jgi:hypothetical protein
VGVRSHPYPLLVTGLSEAPSQELPNCSADQDETKNRQQQGDDEDRLHCRGLIGGIGRLVGEEAHDDSYQERGRNYARPSRSDLQRILPRIVRSHNRSRDDPDCNRRENHGKDEQRKVRHPSSIGVSRQVLHRLLSPHPKNLKDGVFRIRGRL